MSALPIKQNFAQQIRREFIEGSAIAPCLYQAATRIVADTEVLPGGDVTYPIHEGLNWRVTRFGRQSRASLQAVLLLNEDGPCWQVKLSNPRLNAEKGKPQKYETPVNGGSRAFLPAIPPEIRQLISDRYGVEVPLTGSFWDWLEEHPEIPVVPTEGGKKGLSALSQGFVPIPLYGVNGGYQKLPDGTRKLIPDVARFATGGRKFVLGFDQDESETTRRKVSTAISRFGALLKQAGCDVRVATWKHSQGKGVDDLIVQSGIEAWETAYEQALPLEHWRLWQRLEKRLTYSASLRLKTADLSCLSPESIPQDGIVAIASPKGTGKTKAIASLVRDADKVIAGGHRIALMRNLSSRLGLDYRGDLDKVRGDFINGAAYTWRIGLCVDSLLSIDPAKFYGCDLILDECVQVVRHLLTSATCARDGKRPALLNRLHDCMRNARRVIAADADLDNATLHYLKELRGDNSPVFLVRNDYQTEGYNVRLLDCSDRTAIIADLLKDVESLNSGKVLYVCTDNKAASNTIAQRIAAIAPEKRILLINSDTSSGECEREFIQTPDLVLQRNEYDIIICSPSVATGVSIETQGIFAKVYGIFTGAAGTDADHAQSLIRVRDLAVERVVWCAKRGSNFSRVSRSTNPLELKNHLQQRTSATIQLIRSSLREDITGVASAYDWQSDPHANLFSHVEAERNFSALNLRNALLVRLRAEGHKVEVERRDRNPAEKLLLAIARQELKEADAQALFNAPDLSLSEILALEQKEGLDPAEALAVAKFHFREFYVLDSPTIDDILWDNEGRRRGELLNLEAQLFPGVASDRTAKTLERQADWNQGYCPWDISGSALRRRIRSEIGLDDLINKARSGWQWSKYELQSIADRARELTPQIKITLHFTITEGMSDTQIVHQLLSQLGIKLKMKWSRSHPGYEGTKLRIYSLDTEHWDRMWAVLERRQERRSRLQQPQQDVGSPVTLSNQNQTGDPAKKPRISTPPPISEVTPQGRRISIGSIVTRAGSLGQWVVESVSGQVAKLKQLHSWGFGEFRLDELSLVEAIA